MESLKSDEAKNQLKKTSGPPERPSPLKQSKQKFPKRATFYLINIIIAVETEEVI